MLLVGGCWKMLEVYIFFCSCRFMSTSSKWMYWLFLQIDKYTIQSWIQCWYGHQLHCRIPNPKTCMGNHAAKHQDISNNAVLLLGAFTVWYSFWKKVWETFYNVTENGVHTKKTLFFIDHVVSCSKKNCWGPPFFGPDIHPGLLHATLRIIHSQHRPQPSPSPRTNQINRWACSHPQNER